MQVFVITIEKQILKQLWRQKRLESDSGLE